MDDADRKYWFPAKKYGWGWGVANCWPGVLVQLGYPVLVTLALWFCMPRGKIGTFMIFFILLTAAFLAIHWIKGERPYWNWGN